MKNFILKMESLKWIMIGLIIFIFFLLLTPITFYNSYGVYLALFESFICSVFVFMTIFGVKSFGELFNLEILESKLENKTFLITIPFLTLVIGAFFLSHSLEEKINNQILTIGVDTKAKIINGYSSTIKRRSSTNTSYSLTVKFSTKNGDVKIFKTKVDNQIFESIRENQEVDIKYLPESPEIFKIIAGDLNVQKFFKISNRDIEFTDIEKIMFLDQSKILPYLQSISNGWTVKRDEDAYIYENLLKNELIGIIKGDKEYIDFATKKFYIPAGFIGREKILYKDGVTKKNTSGSLSMKNRTFELKNLYVDYVIGEGLVYHLIVRKK